MTERKARRDALILALARAGSDLEAICSKVDLSPNRIKKVLRAAGVSIAGVYMDRGRPMKLCTLGVPHPKGVNRQSCRHCYAAYQAAAQAQRKFNARHGTHRCQIPTCKWPRKSPGVCTPEDGAAACWRRRSDGASR